MADFHQPGCVATLHRLDMPDADAMERELAVLARRRPVALVLPCLYDEFSRPAIWRIIEELQGAAYIDTIVLVLGKASFADLVRVRGALSPLPQRVEVIWNDGPGLTALYRELSARGLDPGPDGKGRSCWIGYGYVLAATPAEVIAAHDCDITTYTRELLTRLCYPVVHRGLGFNFAKGYYARVNGTMNGRVTRLFVTPLVQALRTVVGPHPFVEYLGSFRYALSGEFAMTTELARVNRLPCNWGLEVGALAEVYRHAAPRRICQTEICGIYDHKHQALSKGQPDRGLLKMAADIAEMLLRSLASEGVLLTQSHLKTLVACYLRSAEDVILAYEADARTNSLAYELHAEEEMVEVFTGALRTAVARHLQDPLSVRLMPCWNRVISAIPDVLERLRVAVEGDSRVAAAAQAALADGYAREAGLSEVGLAGTPASPLLAAGAWRKDLDGGAALSATAG